jgi:hypothetical protein
LRAGNSVSRKDLGMPEDWSIIDDWINETRDVYTSLVRSLSAPRVQRNQEIPVLDSYGDYADEKFWETFPENRSMENGTPVKIRRLEKLIKSVWSSWSLPEKIKAEKTLRRLKGKELLKLD